MANVKYKDFFDIDPNYFSAVTSDLIDSGQVKWDKFYPHETFVELLKKTDAMLSGTDKRSIWLEGIMEKSIQVRSCAAT